jgi:hypothetical protein
MLLIVVEVLGVTRVRSTLDGTSLPPPLKVGEEVCKINVSVCAHPVAGDQ